MFGIGRKKKADDVGELRKKEREGWVEKHVELVEDVEVDVA